MWVGQWQTNLYKSSIWLTILEKLVVGVCWNFIGQAQVVQTHLPFGTNPYKKAKITMSQLSPIAPQKTQPYLAGVTEHVWLDKQVVFESNIASGLFFF